jgi:hypothetical protein
MGLSDIIRALLFGMFALLTGALAAVLGPTYDNLLVPELAPSALFPSVGSVVGGAGGTGFLATASRLSATLVVTVVDPAVALVAVGVGVVYFVRAVARPWKIASEPLVARLVVAVILANFALPIAGALLGLASSLYPAISNFDNGAWQHWINIGGFAEAGFSWDNGVLAFVITFVLFSLVLLLAAAVAVRDALLGVLLVLLPIFTLLWPIPPLAPLARRAWTLFGELAFWPCVLVIPLELAVGSPSVLLAMAYLAVALGSPALLSLGGSALSALGLPSAGGAVAGGIQRGLTVGALTLDGYGRGGSPGGGGGTGTASRTLGRLGSAARSAASTPFPAGVPRMAGALVGHGVERFVQHLRALHRSAGRVTSASRDRFPPLPTWTEDPEDASLRGQGPPAWSDE